MGSVSSHSGIKRGGRRESGGKGDGLALCARCCAALQRSES